MSNQHRWESPSEWLRWAWNEDMIDESELLGIVCDLDGDTIQDAFESLMATSGYFDTILGECKDCKEDVVSGEGYKCTDCNEYFHDNYCGGSGGFKLKSDGERIVCWDCAINVVEYPDNELETL